MADQGALRVLDAKLLKVARQNIGDHETVHIALKGNFGQALLALDDRLVVLKAGMMAGATLGGKATSFPYNQVSAIELKAGPVNAVLQIQSSAFQGAQVGSYWTSDKNRDPTKLPNCITAPSSNVKSWRPHLDRIRIRIAAGSWSASASRVPAAADPATTAGAHRDLPEQLAHLADLQRSGVLTRTEFEQAKERLLAGS